ncbi:hypothetical protein BGW41_006354 [Actinomortierella wolfii]|nr:hypothetical protein BGW41_006354 [Actinomortierella wolfii]
MIFHRRALALALAGLATILPAVHAQTKPTQTFTFKDASGAVLNTQVVTQSECAVLDEPALTKYAEFVSASAEDQQAAINLYNDPICQIVVVSTVGFFNSTAVPGVVAMKWQGRAPTTSPPGVLINNSPWPNDMVYQQERKPVLFALDVERGKKVIAAVSAVLVVGVAIGSWKVYKAATYVKPPELVKKKKEKKDREYTGVVGNKKVKKKHAYYRKPVRDANGQLVSSGGLDNKKYDRFQDEEEEEERFDEYGRRLIKDENGEWQVEDRDSSDDTDSEVEERRKKAEKRRRNAQLGRRGSDSSTSSRERDTSSAAASKALGNNGSTRLSGTPGFLKFGGGKRSSAGSSTLASHHQSPTPSTTTFRQNQYTGISGRASPQPVMIDMQETNYQQRRPMGAPSSQPGNGGGNTFAPSPAPQPAMVTTYNLPPPAHTQIDLMRFDSSSPAPSSARNNNGGYDPHQNPYQQRPANDVVVSMPQQYQNHHHPSSPTRRGGYSSDQRV